MSEIYYSILFNRKNKLNKDGKALIQICIYSKGQRKYISTGKYIKPKEWDEKRKLINNYHPDYNEWNEVIEKQIKEIKEKIRCRKEKGEKVSISQLDIINTEELYYSFYDFMQDEIEKNILKESTKKTHRRTLSILREFKKELEFKDINVTFLIDFERYLSRLNYGVNTMYKYFKNIRTYVNLAIAKDLMEINDYPFRKFRLRQVQGKRDFLTPDEVNRLEKLKFENFETEKAKDFFLFSIYTGIRFSDIIKLEKSNFYSIADVIWLQFEMTKSEIKSDSNSKKIIKLPLSKLFRGSPVQIFEKYKDNEKFIFDDFTNAEINLLLKDIEKELKSGKTLSYHVARHTCATNLIFHGVPISTIQKILGHDKIETTQIYAKVMDMTVLNDLANTSF